MFVLHCASVRMAVKSVTGEAKLIIIMGYVSVDPSDMAEFLADIEVIAPATRAERGCLFYAVTPEHAHAGRMLVAERWQDQASLNAHFEGPQTASFQKWMERIRIDIFRYDALNERPVVESPPKISALDALLPY